MRLAMEAAPRSVRSQLGETSLCWKREKGVDSEQLQIRRLVCLPRARPFFLLFIYDIKTRNKRRKNGRGLLTAPSEETRIERAFWLLLGWLGLG